MVLRAARSCAVRDQVYNLVGLQLLKSQRFLPGNVLKRSRYRKVSAREVQTESTWLKLSKHAVLGWPLTKLSSCGTN